MAEANKPDLAELLACVDRELKMRAKVYPRWVKDKKLTQEQADTEIARMQAVRNALLRGAGIERMAKTLHQRLRYRDPFNNGRFEVEVGKWVDEVVMDIRFDKEPQGRLV